MTPIPTTDLSVDEIASGLGIRGAAEVVLSAYLAPTVESDAQYEESRLREIVQRAILQANDYVLREAQARAESVAQGVSQQAELLKVRRNEQEEKAEEFRLLGEKVRNLTAVISEFRNDRAKLIANLPAVESQLHNLIEELQKLRNSARDSRMKALQKNAESLVQSLQAARKKLRDAGA